MEREHSTRARDLAELILGYGVIVGVIWTPEHLQRILSPIVLALTLLVVLAHRQSRDELGLGWRGLIPSLLILPTAIALAALSIFVAAKIGTLHPLYKGDFAHISCYVLWTVYQQFLLQDYFMARMLRLVSSEPAAVVLAAYCSPQRTCLISCSPQPLSRGASSRARCSVVIATSGHSAWPRDCSASASPSASRTRFITTCELGWDICAIVLGRR